MTLIVLMAIVMGLGVKGDWTSPLQAGGVSLRYTSNASRFSLAQKLPADALIRCAASGGESNPQEMEV